MVMMMEKYKLEIELRMEAVTTNLGAPGYFEGLRVANGNTGLGRAPEAEVILKKRRQAREQADQR